MWQNTKFSDLLSKIHYQSENPLLNTLFKLFINFDNGFWKVNPRI